MIKKLTRIKDLVDFLGFSCSVFFDEGSIKNNTRDLN